MSPIGILKEKSRYMSVKFGPQGLLKGRSCDPRLPTPNPNKVKKESLQYFQRKWTSLNAWQLCCES